MTNRPFEKKIAGHSVSRNETIRRIKLSPAHRAGTPLSGFFENSYIPENPRTLKPLIFSKNRIREAKNRSNTSPGKMSETVDFEENEPIDLEENEIQPRKYKDRAPCWDEFDKFTDKHGMLVQMRTIIEIENGGNKYGHCWDLLRTHIFPRTQELPQFPISPKPLFLSKNRLRDSPKRS
ncbi:hypothetical protein LXL04_024082 [Taraxacum kok-saghyz]